MPYSQRLAGAGIASSIGSAVDTYMQRHGVPSRMSSTRASSGSLVYPPARSEAARVSIPLSLKSSSIVPTLL
jgi:hypothetical protein